MSHRLFVAVRPPEDVRDALLDTMEGIDGARWQDAENLHLTLHFIGDVERPVANELADALSRVRGPRFDLAIAGVGHFEHKGRVHALWARVPLTPDLEGLRQQVARACAAAGAPYERRRFVPHITLARLNAGTGPIGGWLAANGALRAGPWEVDAFALFESHLTPAGATYQEVVRFPL